MAELAAADAQLFWLSSVLPNDQFLVYVFDGPVSDGPVFGCRVDPGALVGVRRRAQNCAEFRLRVADDRRWRYPRWVPAEVTDEQFVLHDEEIVTASDQGPAAPVDFGAIARLGRLDATRMTWRVHLFAPGTVVVQMSHALGDGNRCSALAALLLGRRVSVPPVAAPRRGNPLLLGVAAARAHRDLPPSPPPRPVLSVNAAPAGEPVLRSLVIPRDRLRTRTVTVAALAAIGEALGGYLDGRGEDISALAAEVPVAGPPPAQSRNNFRNVSIGLYPEQARGERARRIAADLAAARHRGEHPATRSAAAAFAATPAVLLRWGMGKFDPAVRSATVTGNTVVSSVNRGPADLSFGGRPVRFSAGFPALSPMQSLTHGVHGLGDTVAISVHADSVTVDVDDYLDRLVFALR